MKNWDLESFCFCCNDWNEQFSFNLVSSRSLIPTILLRKINRFRYFIAIYQDVLLAPVQADWLNLDLLLRLDQALSPNSGQQLGEGAQTVPVRVLQFRLWNCDKYTIVGDGAYECLTLSLLKKEAFNSLLPVGWYIDTAFADKGSHQKKN